MDRLKKAIVEGRKFLSEASGLKVGNIVIWNPGEDWLSDDPSSGAELKKEYGGMKARVKASSLHYGGPEDFDWALIQFADGEQIEVLKADLKPSSGPVGMEG